MKKSIITIILATALLSNVYAKQSIQIKGSDTLINMVQKLAEVYMEKNKDASISVTGGGSGTGIAAILNKSTDIANSSREMKSEEYSSAKAKGINVKEVIIAIDALSVIINPQNPVNTLSIEQIGKIYKGEIKNWQEVGGLNKPITLYGRQSNSGTFSFFREKVLGADYSDKMNRMNGNSQIVESVKQDISAIGYVGVGYVVKDNMPIDGIKLLSVSKKAGETAYSPIDKTAVMLGQYEIARGLNQYISGNPKGLVKDFINFELSKEGQNIIEDMGFYPIGSTIIEKNAKTLKAKTTIF
ncbi:MAG: phosphate-binding protein [Candidatus Margulisbacteria bacterium GWF2_35_9]|nr:MAG: phosphate-binding protein [Candidatus Margulisbacteria bacterium GWF2_35_9]